MTESSDSATRVAPTDTRTFTTCMEQLQDGYVASIAATAGCTVEPVNRDVYGFDTLIIRSAAAGVEEVSVYVQLKNTTTVQPDPRSSSFPFQFKKRDHFDRLAGPRRGIKALLIVMASPPVQAAWSEAGHDALTVRHCCYWKHLEGETVRPEVQSPTVRIPTANVFDAGALTRIMDKLDQGEPLR